MPSRHLLRKKNSNSANRRRRGRESRPSLFNILFNIEGLVEETMRSIAEAEAREAAKAKKKAAKEKARAEKEAAKEAARATREAAEQAAKEERTRRWVHTNMIADSNDESEPTNPPTVTMPAHPTTVLPNSGPTQFIISPGLPPSTNTYYAVPVGLLPQAGTGGNWTPVAYPALSNPNPVLRPTPGSVSGVTGVGYVQQADEAQPSSGTDPMPPSTVPESSSRCSRRYNRTEVGEVIRSPPPRNAHSRRVRSHSTNGSRTVRGRLSSILASSTSSQPQYKCFGCDKTRSTLYQRGRYFAAEGNNSFRNLCSQCGHRVHRYKETIDYAEPSEDEALARFHWCRDCGVMRSTGFHERYPFGTRPPEDYEICRMCGGPDTHTSRQIHANNRFDPEHELEEDVDDESEPESRETEREPEAGSDVESSPSSTTSSTRGVVSAWTPFVSSDEETLRPYDARTYRHPPSVESVGEDNLSYNDTAKEGGRQSSKTSQNSANEQYSKDSVAHANILQPIRNPPTTEEYPSHENSVSRPVSPSRPAERWAGNSREQDDLSQPLHNIPPAEKYDGKSTADDKNRRPARSSLKPSNAGGSSHRDIKPRPIRISPPERGSATLSSPDSRSVRFSYPEVSGHVIVPDYDRSPIEIEHKPRKPNPNAKENSSKDDEPFRGDESVKQDEPLMAFRNGANISSHPMAVFDDSEPETSSRRYSAPPSTKGVSQHYYESNASQTDPASVYSSRPAQRPKFEDSETGYSWRHSEPPMNGQFNWSYEPQASPAEPTRFHDSKPRKIPKFDDSRPANFYRYSEPSMESQFNRTSEHQASRAGATSFSASQPWDKSPYNGPYESGGGHTGPAATTSNPWEKSSYVSSYEARGFNSEPDYAYSSKPCESGPSDWSYLSKGAEPNANCSPKPWEAGSSSWSYDSKKSYAEPTPARSPKPWETGPSTWSYEAKGAQSQAEPASARAPKPCEQKSPYDWSYKTEGACAGRAFVSSPKPWEKEPAGWSYGAREAPTEPTSSYSSRPWEKTRTGWSYKPEEPRAESAYANSPKPWENLCNLSYQPDEGRAKPASSRYSKPPHKDMSDYYYESGGTHHGPTSARSFSSRYSSGFDNDSHSPTYLYDQAPCMDHRESRDFLDEYRPSSADPHNEDSLFDQNQPEEDRVRKRQELYERYLEAEGRLKSGNTYRPGSAYSSCDGPIMFDTHKRDEDKPDEDAIRKRQELYERYLEAEGRPKAPCPYPMPPTPDSLDEHHCSSSTKSKSKTKTKTKRSKKKSTAPGQQMFDDSDSDQGDRYKYSYDRWGNHSSENHYYSRPGFDNDDRYGNSSWRQEDHRPENYYSRPDPAYNSHYGYQDNDNTWGIPQNWSDYARPDFRPSSPPSAFADVRLTPPLSPFSVISVPDGMAATPGAPKAEVWEASSDISKPTEKYRSPVMRAIGYTEAI